MKYIIYEKELIKKLDWNAYYIDKEENVYTLITYYDKQINKKEYITMIVMRDYYNKERLIEHKPSYIWHHFIVAY